MEAKGQDHLAFIIQTKLDRAIYFYDYHGTSREEDNHHKVVRLIDEHLKVHLEMHRGFFNCMYYTVWDDGTSGDSIEEFSLRVDENDKLCTKIRQIYAPQTGEILAFEMDPLNSNDVHVPASSFADSETKWSGKTN